MGPVFSLRAVLAAWSLQENFNLESSLAYFREHGVFDLRRAGVGRNTFNVARTRRARKRFFERGPRRRNLGTLGLF